MPALWLKLTNDFLIDQGGFPGVGRQVHHMRDGRA